MLQLVTVASNDTWCLKVERDHLAANIPEHLKRIVKSETIIYSTSANYILITRWQKRQRKQNKGIKCNCIPQKSLHHKTSCMAYVLSTCKTVLFTKSFWQLWLSEPSSLENRLHIWVSGLFILTKLCNKTPQINISLSTKLNQICHSKTKLALPVACSCLIQPYSPLGRSLTTDVCYIFIKSQEQSTFFTQLANVSSKHKISE